MGYSPFFENTYSILYRNSEQRPDAVAIESPGFGPLSYSGLLHVTHNIMRNLWSAEIRHTDRVAIVLPGGPDMAICLLGVSMAAICAPLNPLYQQHEFENYLSALGARLLVTHAEIDSPERIAAERMNIPVLILANLQKDASGPPASNPGETSDLPLFRLQAPGPQDIAIVLHTSGTTARPKIVPLTQKNICVAVDYVCKSLALGPDDRCLSMMPQFHIGGFVDLLLSPLASGGSIIPAPGFDADQFLSLLEKYQPTWYQGVPATLSMLLTHAKSNQIERISSSLRFIRSVASPLYPRLKQDLESLFQVPVIETFGMTEAAPLITSNSLPPGLQKVSSTGKTVGPDVAIMDTNGNLLPAGKTGEIVVRGENIMSGYENDPEANALAFAHGWFHTGDLGYLDEDGYLFITGRVKEMINRGGEKISPQEIDSVLLEHSSVAEVMAFPIPHTLLGEDIAAAVVLADGEQVSQNDLIEFALNRLSVFKLPRIIFFVKKIPRGPTGKPLRIGAIEKLDLAEPKPLEKEAIAPRTHSEMVIARIWMDILKIDRIGVHDDFFDLGGDSLKAALLLKTFETQCNFSFPLSILYRFRSISEQARLIENSIDLSLKGIIPSIRTDKQKNIFWILCYFDSQDIPLVPLATCYEQDPHKDKLLLTVQEMAETYIRQIRQHIGKGPYYLGGYSIGGLIAIEVAHQLQRMGEDVPLLFLVDPHIKQDPPDDRGIISRIKKYSAINDNLKLKDKIVRFLFLLREDFMSATLKYSRKSAHLLFRFHKHLPFDHRQYYVSTIYSNAARNYVPSEFQGKSILYFRKSHPAVTKDLWKQFCPNGEVHIVDVSTHEEIIRHPWNTDWMEKLRKCMLNPIE